MKRVVLLVALAASLGLPTAAGADGAPVGATARCRDGTYSFSQHHQGTCSHHRGVAEWLDGSSASSQSPTRRAAPTTSARVVVGVTVPLARRTKSAGCTLGPNPDRRCSPGAYYSKLTKAVICSAGFRTSSIRNVPESEKFAVEREYGMRAGHYGSSLEIDHIVSLELDHIVSLELGGSNDIANLYPEKLYARLGFRVKDRLENRLHSMVCAGSIGLRPVQRAIASNWQGLYKRVFGVAPA
jgi:Protein of unknown function (DUF3761)